MGSLRLNGVQFTAYTMDHEPRHVHGFYAEVEVIVDLRRDGNVVLADRSAVLCRAMEAKQTFATFSPMPQNTSTI